MTDASRWRPRSGWAAPRRRIVERIRWVTAERARSAELPLRRVRPPSPSAAVRCSTSVSSSTLGPLGPGVVVVGLGGVDVLAAGHGCAPRTDGAAVVVEHLAGRGLLDAAAHQLEAVHLAARRGEQPRQVGDSLRRLGVDGPPGEVDLPEVTAVDEPRLGSTAGRARRRHPARAGRRLGGEARIGEVVAQLVACQHDGVAAASAVRAIVVGSCDQPVDRAPRQPDHRQRRAPSRRAARPGRGADRRAGARRWCTGRRAASATPSRAR